jgi:UDP-3-O-[3-hydroxymyristoyl] glucosamine N-acyltransferase
MIPAHELVSGGGRPRRLRCSGLLLSELARQHGMAFDGKDGEVGRFSTLDGLSRTDEGIAITYLTSSRFAGLLRSGSDVAVVTRVELRGCLQEGNVALIVEGDPHDLFYSAFAAAVENGNFERLRPFVSPAAQVHEMAVIGDNVHIEAGAVVSACAVILPNTYIGPEVCVKPNATVGGDGFENAIIRGRRTIVPHAGGVWLSEGVQVGSSTCIDRGLIGDFSFVGARTTIDNLVHFAHGARTGQNCSLVACSEVSGAAILGDGVWLGPNVSVNQGLTIGDHCYVGTGAVVTRNLPPHSLAYGSPAKVAAQVCVCRSKLQFDQDLATCGTCGKRYRLDPAGQVQHA